MKFLSSLSSILLFASTAFATSPRVELSTRQTESTTCGGIVTAPRFQLGVAPNNSFPFKYTPRNWCGANAVVLTIWLTHRPVDNSHVSSTGEIVHPQNDTVLWKYGTYTQPGWEGVPEAGDNSPRTLIMPDFTHLGIVPNRIWLNVVEWAFLCGGPTQYRLTSMEMINT